jgi:hypothetical protein
MSGAGTRVRHGILSFCSQAGFAGTFTFLLLYLVAGSLASTSAEDTTLSSFARWKPERRLQFPDRTSGREVVTIDN